MKMGSYTATVINYRNLYRTVFRLLPSNSQEEHSTDNMADRRPGRRRSRSRSRSRSRRLRTTRPRSPRARTRSPRIPLRLKQREDLLPPAEPEEHGKKPLPANIIRARVIGTGDDAKYMVTVDGADIEITTPFFCQLCHAQCHAASIHSHLTSKKHTKRMN